jgi:hypothetical protein
MFANLLFGDNTIQLWKLPFCTPTFFSSAFYEEKSFVTFDIRPVEKKPPATDAIAYCKFCGKIFIGTAAHDKHVAESHSDEVAIIRKDLSRISRIYYKSFFSQNIYDYNYFQV